MKANTYLLAGLLAASALVAGCNENSSSGGTAGNSPPIVTSPSGAAKLSELAASIIAMITGSACATASPGDINGIDITPDDTAQDANRITPSCT